MEYFKDYYIDNKYIGSKICKKDRDVFGFYGRNKEILNETIKLSNNKTIRKGLTVFTELQILCEKK